MSTEELVRIAGEPSFRISNRETEVFITKSCGMMAPVTFFRHESKPIKPYFINPWHNENYTDKWRLMEVLRGDFFCLPFGGDNVWGKEEHPMHGESANKDWTFVSMEKKEKSGRLTLEMRTEARPGCIRKEVSLIDGHSAVYSRHTVSGFSGPTPLGHHATLDGNQGTMLIDSSPILEGRTGRHPPGHHGAGEYYSLESEVDFDSLGEVPTVWKDIPKTDCSVFPSRNGFIDIAQIHTRPESHPSWITVTNHDAGYVWFALKDPKILPSTVLWTENHGRHNPPWNGRNCCIGIEDVCSCAANGLGDSVSANAVNGKGVPTSHTLTDEKDFVVNYIQGVVRICDGFERVHRIDFGEGRITLISGSGESIHTDVDHRFLYGDETAL